MRNFRMTYLYPLNSLFKENRFLFEDGKEGGDDGSGGDGSSGDASQGGDGSDAASGEGETKEEKKWGELRTKNKDLETKLEEEREARLKAEGRAEAVEEIEQKKLEEKKKKEEKEKEIETAPEDEEYVATLVAKELKKRGLDPEKLNETNKRLEEQAQSTEVNRLIDRACDNLTNEFDDSVPFDRDKVLEYAREKGYGVAMSDRPLEDVLRLAHKEMNEEAFDEWKFEARKKKKKVPDTSTKGTGKKEVKEEETPKDVAGFRKMADQISEDSDE